MRGIADENEDVKNQSEWNEIWLRELRLVPKMLFEWTKKLQKRIRNGTYETKELTLVELRGLISKIWINVTSFNKARKAQLNESMKIDCDGSWGRFERPKRNFVCWKRNDNGRFIGRLKQMIGSLSTSESFERDESWINDC
ncbi:MAG: hypothetical protein ACTS7I_00370 [Candidatus Hodgkinia cicadicola]